MKRLFLFPGLLLFSCTVFCQNADSLAAVAQVDSMLNQSLKLYMDSRFEEGLPLALATADYAKKELGSAHANYALALNRAGSFYFQLGKYDKTEAVWLEAKDIRERVLGKESAAYAQSLNNLAALYYALGNLDKNEEMHLEARDIRARTLGREHVEYAQSLQNLSIVYNDRYEYARAEAAIREASRIYEKALGAESPIYVQSLAHLAMVKKSLGQVWEAEQLCQKSLAILTKAGKKKTAEYATALHTLALIYHENGNYAKAEPLYLESYALKSEIYGKDHPQCAYTLMNLGNLNYSWGKTAQAEPFYIWANDIYENAFGKENEHVATALANLASYFSDNGELEKAETYLLEAADIFAKVMGKESMHHANTLMNLGKLRYDQNRYDEAETLFLEAQNIFEKTVGKSDFKHTLLLYNLATNYRHCNKNEQAAEYFKAGNQSIREHIRNAARYFSETEMRSYLKTFEQQSAGFYSFFNDQPASGITGEAFDNALFHKGFLLNSLLQVKNRARSDSATSHRFDAFADVHRRLSAEFAKPATIRKGIAKLEAQADSLEKELVRAVNNFGDLTRQTLWQEVQAVLRPGEAAIEFVHFQYLANKPTANTHYAAIALLPGKSHPVFIPLFEEKQLAALLQSPDKGQVVTLYASRGAKPVVIPGQANLYDLVWKPLESALETVEKIFFSPSGMLHQINFSAMPLSEKTKTLSDKFDLVELGSTRQLVIPSEVNIKNNDALLFGGIQYEMDSTATSQANASNDFTIASCGELSFAYTDSTLRIGTWGALPFTDREVSSVEKTLKSAGFQSETRRGFAATEEAFKTIGAGGKPSPRVLHLATHGFFFPDPTVNPPPSTANRFLKCPTTP